jgi:hypothetical protein
MSSTPFGSQDSLSQSNSNDALKWRFTVSFGRMLYEYELRSICEERDSINMAIIKEYENQTGIAARSTQDLIQAFEIKNDVKDQVNSNLQDCLKANKRLTRGNKALKFGIAVFVPAAFVGGFIVANKLN